MPGMIGQGPEFSSQRQDHRGSLAKSHNRRFALDCYRRLIHILGTRPGNSQKEVRGTPERAQSSAQDRPGSRR